MDLRTMRSTHLLLQEAESQMRTLLRPDQRDDAALERLYEQACRGMTSRHSISYRSLSADVAGAGGFLTSSDVRDAMLPLPPESIVGKAGVRVDTLAVPGNAPVQPVWDSLPSFEWLPTETTQLSDQTPLLRAVATSSKLGGAFVRVSYQLDRQSNAIETLRSVLRRVAAIGIDTAVLNGSGASGEPMGLLNATGINDQSGTSLAWDGICSMEEAVALNNASDANLVWVAHPGVRKLLRQREQITGGGRAIWKGNTVAGHRAMVSTSVPSAVLILGDFSNATVVLWGGVEVLINPYSTTGFQAGILELAVFVACDVIVNYPAAFAKSESIT